MIRVVLADDQTLVRKGIRGLLDLTPDVRVAAEAADGDQAIAAIDKERPQVALLDVRMPAKTGIEVARWIQSQGLPTRSILLTTFDDDSALLDGIRAGIAGFLLKDASLEQLVEAIRAVASGKTLILPALTERATQFVRKAGNAFDALPEPERLTQREREILRLIAGGYSNREVADAFGMAEGTVKNHASSIFSKLGVRDRTRAVLKAIELGYLT